VVDLDVEKFFDQVHYQRLMARLSVRISDKRLLVLIGKMLKAKVVMADGVVVATEQGVPQGGPLSPLLSNIVLDELDWELAQVNIGLSDMRTTVMCTCAASERGHRMKRTSERLKRDSVMASIKTFIKRRLRLTVNEETQYGANKRTLEARQRCGAARESAFCRVSSAARAVGWIC
jgi:RNA-directed DNA polymerase